MLQTAVHTLQYVVNDSDLTQKSTLVNCMGSLHLMFAPQVRTLEIFSGSLSPRPWMLLVVNNFGFSQKADPPLKTHKTFTWIYIVRPGCLSLSLAKCTEDRGSAFCRNPIISCWTPWEDDMNLIDLWISLGISLPYRSSTGDTHAVIKCNWPKKDLTYWKVYMDPAIFSMEATLYLTYYVVMSPWYRNSKITMKFKRVL